MDAITSLPLALECAVAISPVGYGCVKLASERDDVVMTVCSVVGQLVCSWADLTFGRRCVMLDRRGF